MNGSTKHEDYWDGALFVYHSTLLNGAGSGNITASFVPGEGNELEFLFGAMTNRDTSTRTMNAAIDTGTTGDNLWIWNSSTAAGGRMNFPNSGDTVGTEGSSGGRYILGGPMRLLLTAESIAGSQDTEPGVVFRLRGGVPTIVTSVSLGGTVTENIRQVV